MHKVVITQRFIDEQTLAYLRAHGCEPVLPELPAGQADGDVSQETLAQWLQGASGWIVGHARVTRALLEQLPDLQIVSRRGVGYDRVDVAAVKDLGKVAAIAAGSNDATVADVTLGLMLAAGRRFPEGADNLRQGSWAIPVGADLYRKTVGVVGLGRIGQGVVRRLRGFEARILVHSRTRDAALAREGGFEYADMPTLFAESDYLTLHTPLNDATRFLVRDDTLKLMKPTAFVINTARGGLVEDRHLLAALKEKRIAGAGLDVFVSEADPSYQDVTRELVALPNVVALPHAGASTHDGLARMNRVAAQSVVAVLTGGEAPPGCIVADGRPAISAKG